MTGPIPAYPLQWPAGWERSTYDQRAFGRFGKQVTKYGSPSADGSRGSWKKKGEVSIAEAVTRVRTELGRMGVDDDDLVISTNVELRLDGFPRSGRPEPSDPGACVYWRTNDGEARCMAIDRYHGVAHNLAAIAATLEAMRAIERHGGAEILNRAFTGFVALPEPGTTEHWCDVLGVPEGADAATVQVAYQRLRSQHHPDKGGDPEAFNRIQRAWESRP